METIQIDPGATAISREFQRWKYWDPHPFFNSARSHVLTDESSIVAHACGWPVHLHGPFGEFPSVHLIDWAASRSVPGAGSRALRLFKADVAAVFSIGGSPMTRKILPALGFKSCNIINFMQRPLHPLYPALRDSPRDWKMPARVLRNLNRYAIPRLKIPTGWSVSAITPAEIADSLLPRSSGMEAVSLRSAKVLEHMMACPAFQQARCYLLKQHEKPAAYFCLASVREQARLIDYGPSGLDTDGAEALGMAAQLVGQSDFGRMLEIVTTTTEQSVADGFRRAGFRSVGEEPINVLKLHRGLDPIDHFRMTLADWDAACL